MNEKERERKEIKSIKQIADDIRKAKTEFQQVLNALSIPSITLEEDLTKRTPTIETILKDLPPEQRLKEMMDHPYAETPEIRQKILSNYKGKYEIIKRAAENIKNLKCEAEKIYYLAAQLNLYKIKSEFDPEQHEEVRLKSYEVYSNENNRMPKYEKNMINPLYLRELREEETKNATVTPNDCLPPGQALVNLSLYDSINGEKVYEYLCYGQETLLQVVCKFYCLIARLQGKQSIHWANSYCFIEDNFYYHGNTAHKKIDEIIAFSNHNLEEDGIKTEHSHSIYQMTKTKIKSLRVVFGRPYLFRHLQGCDHIIIFKDMHILPENQAFEPIRKDKYPLAVFEGRMRRRKCDGCRFRYSEWVSLNDPLKNGKHAYLCKECHFNLHDLDKEGQVFVRYRHD